jgi:hypothetical protein
MKLFKNFKLKILLEKMKSQIKENEKQISEIDKTKFVEYFDKHGFDNFTVSSPDIDMEKF